MRNLILILHIIVGNNVYSQNTTDKIISTSIIKLISNPEEFHNKRIRIVGYLKMEFEGNSIYLHKDDYESRNYQNAFWISLTDDLKKEIIADESNETYVSLVGTFKMDEHGHRGLWPGEIRNIEFITKRD